MMSQKDRRYHENANRGCQTPAGYHGDASSLQGTEAHPLVKVWWCQDDKFVCIVSLQATTSLPKSPQQWSQVNSQHGAIFRRHKHWGVRETRNSDKTAYSPLHPTTPALGPPSGRGQGYLAPHGLLTVRAWSHSGVRAKLPASQQVTIQRKVAMRAYLDR